MQTVELFVKENLSVPSSSNFAIGLDYINNDPIKITKSIQSIEEPQATTSSFSKVFRAPNTPPNAKFFKGVFNVNSVTFDATKKVAAYINVNGVYFASGNVRLNNIYYALDDEKIEYELIFMGETSNFSSIVSPKDLSSLNMSGLSHTINYSNIQISWAGNLLSGNVVYPLAEYGYTYDATTKQPNIPTLSVYNATTGVKGFTNSANPLNLTQFKPFVKAKYIWDRIFTEAGFTYTSNFLTSSPIFNKLFMVSSDSSTSDSELVLSPSLTTSMNAYSNYAYTAYDYIKLSFPNEFTDTANNWNTTDSIYTTVSTGATAGYTYTFTMSNLNLYYSAPAKAGSPPTSYTRTFTLRASVNSGVAVYDQTAYLDVGTGSAVYNQASPVYSSDPYGVLPSQVFTWTINNMTQGSTVEFYIYLGNEVSAGTSFVSGTLGATGPSVVDPSGLMPSQYKQIEFIKGINDRFKLMWEPDPENPTNFLIEPWIDWIQDGVQKDWTDKLDRNQAMSITPLFQTQPREVIFKDSEESDLYNFSYQQENKQTFGQLNQDSGIEILTGSREIKSMFAPVPLGPIGNSNKFIIPHFAKDTETERQPIQIKPRLVFYNGTGPAPITWYMKNDSGTAVAQTSYPIASSFSSYPFNSSVLDLNWTNVKQFWNEANYTPAGSGRTPITAYSTYWQKWFNFTYSPYGRIMEATFVLDVNDLSDLKFNDKIFIRDSWWLPIEVKDYELNGVKQPVRVKLVKLGDDVGVSIGGLPTSLTLHQSINVGSSGCDACCNTDRVPVDVYTNSETFDNSTLVFFDYSGTVPASPGSYSDGTSALNVDANGIVTSITLCSLCSCAGTLTSMLVCSATSVCGACCCAAYSQTIYGNGATLATSTSIYGDSMGTTSLIPYNWYKNSSATVQVGADGTTIVAFGTCTGCVCEE